MFINRTLLLINRSLLTGETEMMGKGKKHASVTRSLLLINRSLLLINRSLLTGHSRLGDAATDADRLPKNGRYVAVSRSLLLINRSLLTGHSRLPKNGRYVACLEKFRLYIYIYI